MEWNVVYYFQIMLTVILWILHVKWNKALLRKKSSEGQIHYHEQTEGSNYEASFS
jgi:hypothetical protein